MPEAAPLTEAPAAQPQAPVAPTDADILAQLEAQGGKPAESAAPEAPKEAPPEPQTPKESALVRSMKLREQRLIADRQRDREERAAWEGSFEHRVRQRVEAEVGKILADSKAIEQKQKTPEEIAREAREAAEKGNTEFQQYLQTQARQKAVSEYTALAKQMDAKGEIPHVFDEWSEEELVHETDKLVAELREDCQRKKVPMPTGNIDAKLLRILDKRAKVKQDSRTERQKARGADVTKKATPQGEPKADANGSGHQGEKAGASATTTLGKGLGERQTMQAPDPVLLSDAEVIERAQDALNKGLNIRPR